MSNSDIQSLWELTNEHLKSYPLEKQIRSIRETDSPTLSKLLSAALGTEDYELCALINAELVVRGEIKKPL